MKKIGIICPSEIAFRRFLPALKDGGCFEYAGVAIASKEEFVGATDEILAKERAKAQTFVDSYGGKIFEGYKTLIHSDGIDAIYLPLPPVCITNGLKKPCLQVSIFFVKSLALRHWLQRRICLKMQRQKVWQLTKTTCLPSTTNWKLLMIW